MSALFGVDGAFFALLMAAAFVGFVISSTLGVGGAMLLIPLLAQQMPAAQAVALCAPVMLFNNALKAWVFRRHVDKRATLLVSALALPLAFVGAMFNARFDDRAILLGVAALIVFSIVAERAFEKRVAVSPRSLVLWGGFSGFVSGVCGAAGPSTAIGLRGYGLEREAFVGTVAWYAILLQLVKIPAYMGTGVLPSSRWPLALALSANAAVGVALAPLILARMPKRVFSYALDALLAVCALWLVVDVIRR